MTPLDTDTSVVIDSRLVVSVTRKSGDDAVTWTSPTLTAGASTPLSIIGRSTMVPSFTQRGHSIRQVPALRAANFSADKNEYHREHFVVRLPPKSSNRDNGDSIWWWWGSSLETSNATLEPPTDRIVQQINYIPASYSRRRLLDRNAISVKTIYVPGVDIEKGRGKFVSGQCLVDACTISTDPSDAAKSHMRLFYSDSPLFRPSARVKPPGQIWMMYVLESPASSAKFHNVDDLINWTATFRWDSTVVTPYAKFVSFPLTSHQSMSPSLNGNRYAGNSASMRLPTMKNYAGGKTKLVAWFVSNCYSKNERGSYVEELSRHVPVDVFGACGMPSCERDDPSCWRRLRREYKFYLSFENSNCDYYITEKFFDNGLKYSIVENFFLPRNAL